MKRRRKRRRIAILICREEDRPPSSAKTLRHFMRVAARHDAEGELIEQADFHRLADFDSLFIRTTTAPDHYTYRFAAEAQHLGMSVIDDTTSIEFCCSKIAQTRRFQALGLPMPRTLVLERREAFLPYVAEHLGLPVVLKVPNGCFSRGTVKAENLPDLRMKADLMWASHEEIIAQEWMPTAFDWRIGILNGLPMYACRYQMAYKHWQVVKYCRNRSIEGGYTTVPVSEVPEAVDLALAATAGIGRGLYGVDIKPTARGPMLIETNDNPTLDHGDEDAICQDVIWDELVEYLLR